MSRTGWDGKPLTEAGERFYALRESGYRGWIDQDGYAMTQEEVDAWCAEQNARLGITPASPEEREAARQRVLADLDTAIELSEDAARWTPDLLEGADVDEDAA